METLEYNAVPKEETDSYKKEKKHWKPMFRQILVCSGVCISLFLSGLSVGAPTVFIPQIRKESNNTVITDDMASWLTSMYSFSGFPSVIILSIAAKLYGRKYTFLFAVVDMLVAFVILYYSSNTTQILISLIMQGFFTASQLVVAVMILTEYVLPKYRGLFLTIKSATFFWGIWASNAIGTFFHWKIIPLFGIVCALVSFVTVISWPESPYWLASKGKFEQCAASHRWLKGCDKESEKELKSLIDSQREYIVNSGNKNILIVEQIKDFFKTIGSKEFYKPTLLSMITGSLSVFSGKLVCTVYALDIIMKITNSESTAYIGMLILDGVTILSMYAGCILLRFLKRRPLLLVTSSIAVVFLFIIALYLYLISLELITENKYVSVSLLTALSIAVACGPFMISVSVCAELIPLRSRNLATCSTSLHGKLIIALILKFGPLLYKTFGMHGFFFTFGICSFVIILVLYRYLPETKDKTLQEIVDRLNGIQHSDNVEESENGKLLVHKKDENIVDC